MDSKVTSQPRLKSNTLHGFSLTSPPPISDFMAALSDPGGFSKAAEKQTETMKGLGIEQTDAKADAKKKKEEETKKGNKLTRLYFLSVLKNDNYVER